MAVDISMICFDGRLFFKQYLPHKPTKWEIKAWEITDCSTWYCLDFDVYTGKSYEQALPNGIGYDVIRKLTEPYQNRGHMTRTLAYSSEFGRVYYKPCCYTLSYSNLHTQNWSGQQQRCWQHAYQTI